MTRGEDQLERLFSRCLDAEASAEEQERLDTLLLADDTLRQRYEEYCQLDALAGETLRGALATSASTRSWRWLRRGGRLIGLAAAAALAALAWLDPPQPSTVPRSETPTHASSWFAPTELNRDMVEPLPREFERPEIRLRGTQRDWLIIPGDRPGQFMVVEIDRVRTHAIRLQEDL